MSAVPPTSEQDPAALARKCSELEKDLHEARRSQQAAEDSLAKAEAARLAHAAHISRITKLPNQIPDNEVRLRVDGIHAAIQDLAASVRAINPRLDKLPQDASDWLPLQGFSLGEVLKSERSDIIVCLILGALASRFALEHYFGDSAEPFFCNAVAWTKAADGTEAAILKPWLQSNRALLAVSQPNALPQAHQRLIDRTVRDFRDLLSPVLPAYWNLGIEKFIRGITTTALDPFAVLHDARATYRMEFVSPTAGGKPRPFNASTMQAQPVEGEEVIQGSISPGLYKWGDEWREHQDKSTVICPARVILR